MRRAAWLLGTAFAVQGALVSPVLAAQPPNRVAVVIGNGDYDGVADLANARADAERMSALLSGLGFTVFTGVDLDRQAFEALLRQATLNAREGSEIVFFYAGHGIQIGRRNYLLPTDVDFDSIYDLPVESVTLDRVIELLSAKGNVHLAIVDACRDNPFPDAKLAGGLDASLFETRTGFDVMQTPINSMIAFSTAPGQVALDGPPGENSPYVTAINYAINQTPEAEVTQLFATVRERVYDATSGQQVPWESSTLLRPYRFQVQQAAVKTPVTPSEPSDESERSVFSVSLNLPPEVSLRVDYNRVMDIGAQIAEIVPSEALSLLEVAARPGNGSVQVGDGLFYLPELQDRKSSAGAMTLRDSFTVSTGQSSEMRVSLEIDVNACDLHAGDALDPGGIGIYRQANEIDVLPALVACEAAVAAHPEETRFLYQLGRVQQASGDYELAYRTFLRAQQSGYERANYAVARLLTSEQVDRRLFDVPVDQTQAFALLEESIARADPFAMHLLGRFLLREGATGEERERGFDLLDRAAEMGHTYSMNELGIYFLTKDSDHFIPDRGMTYLNASARRSDIFGYHNLGIVALLGLDGKEPDLATAANWFVRASDGGHPNSPSTLGRMIVRGQIEAPLSEAVRYYDIGLDRGDAWGGVNAANMILRGEVAGFTAYDALVRAAKAAELSDPEPVGRAQSMLGDASSGDVARAVQQLLNDLGQTVAIDGAIGPQTRTAINGLMTSAGLAAPGNDARDQLSALAKLWWQQNPIRSDVF